MIARICSALAIAGFAAAPLAAQTWQSRTMDTGALLHGGAFAPQGTLEFACTAPSPGGRPLIETGDHESNRTEPFDMIVSLSHDLVDPFNVDPDLTSVRVTLDQVTYGLPVISWSDFHGDWSVHLPMSDPFFAAVLRSESLRLDPGRGTAYQYPTDGLAEALQAAMSHCLGGWQMAGFQIPSYFQEFMPSASSGSIPAMSADMAMDVALDTHIRQGCGGAYTLDRNELGLSDFDRDGARDIVLDWGDVSCLSGMARPFCGAANCSIDIFLSSRAGRPPEGFLGVGFGLRDAPNDAPGLIIGGTAAVCATGVCDRPLWWNGTAFQR